MAIPRVTPSSAPIVTVTIRQRKFVENLADFPEDQWTEEILMEVARLVGFSDSAARVVINNERFIEAARRKRNGLPIILRSLGTIARPQVVSGVSRRQRANPDYKRPPNEPLWSDMMEKFCQEMVSDIEGNVKKAALRAGYSTGEYGWKLTQMPKIRARIQYLKEERAEKYKADADDVIRKLVMLANVNIIDFVKSISSSGTINFENSNDISRDKLYGLRKINKTITTIASKSGEERTIEKVNVETSDPLRALKYLMDHLGLVTTQGRITDPEEYVQELRNFAEAVGEAVPGGEI